MKRVFTSQISTTKEQSQRLLELGLMPETADMTWRYLITYDSYSLEATSYAETLMIKEKLNKKPVLGVTGDAIHAKCIPAWSLHRLIQLLPVYMCGEYELAINRFCVCYRKWSDIIKDYDAVQLWEGPCLFDNVINSIEWLIEQGNILNDIVTKK